MTYVFLQQYWWFLISLLGALLVFLLFVQGGNSLLFALGKTADLRTLMVNSTGRKWEFTFTTLVTFGGAFFASFPLFYSTSFGGAYWLWMIILFTFVLQAVSYEFQSKIGNLLGKKTYQRFLVINGWVAPFLLGGVVATFFTGSNFIVDKGNMGSEVMPVVSSWANASHGLDALLNPWNWVLGLAVLFLSRLLGNLYFINTIEDDELIPRCRRKLLIDTVPFLLFFLTFMGYVLLAEGYAVDAQGIIVLESQKYLHNFLSMPLLSALFLAGVMGVLFGILKSMVSKTYKYGIWFAGIGTVWVVLSLFLVVGYHHTAYYPSTADLQSSLTLSNSCSSEFTLRTMAYVSMLIPFVLAYICYAWSMLNKKQITMDEVKKEEEVY
ncbi:cytochrome d ubiquinol oxidase subunit II [Phocaeicola abscessus]|uniref:cytochrome d ubiquinol oxidase subunit II n=1 Tax=Phocaeicola abscessus TaxID=555313 RepID=UPI000386C010|nr:cytochrome d ubiquinol oxidase subunit II [Phocaeicola abscessus]EPT34223.1 putative cytochrome d ubiquinol oxidase, subunit II [Bacteroidetes bacterium oral taxon 272 str. F0290]